MEKQFKVTVDLSCASTVGSAMIIFLVALEDAWRDVRGVARSVEHGDIVKRIMNAQNDTALALYGAPADRASRIMPQTFAAEAVDCSRARVRVRGNVVSLLRRIEELAEAELVIEIEGLAERGHMGMACRFRAWDLRSPDTQVAAL